MQQLAPLPPFQRYPTVIPSAPPVYPAKAKKSNVHALQEALQRDPNIQATKIVVTNQVKGLGPKGPQAIRIEVSPAGQDTLIKALRHNYQASGLTYQPGPGRYGRFAIPHLGRDVIVFINQAPQS